MMIPGSRPVVLVATLWLLGVSLDKEEHRGTELTETHRERRGVPAQSDERRVERLEAVAPRFARPRVATRSVRLCVLCDSVFLFSSASSELKGVDALLRVYDHILDEAIS